MAIGSLNFHVLNSMRIAMSSDHYKMYYLDLYGFNKFMGIPYASYVEFVQSIVGYYHTCSLVR